MVRRPAAARWRTRERVPSSNGALRISVFHRKSSLVELGGPNMLQVAEYGSRAYSLSLHSAVLRKSADLRVQYLKRETKRSPRWQQLNAVISHSKSSMVSLLPTHTVLVPFRQPAAERTAAAPR